MLTLKIMWDEPRPGDHRLDPPPDAGREFVEGAVAVAGCPDHYASRTRWITDVIAVEILDRGIYNAWRQARARHGSNVSGYTWLWMGDDESEVRGPFGKDDPPRDVALTLILVSTREQPDGLIVLVEKAWLLGPDGQTVDRVAP